MGVAREMSLDRAPQHTPAHAMDDPELGETMHQGVVELAIEPVQGLVHFTTPQIHLE